MTTTVQQLISRDRSSADLAPLAANDTFSAAANKELATLEDAAERAQAAAAKNEDLTGVVTTFSSAVTSLRAIHARFPETAAPIAEAIKQTQIAMGMVKDNPVPVKAAVAPPATASKIAPPPPPPPAPAATTHVAPQVEPERKVHW
jgi:hypothetical protein